MNTARMAAFSDGVIAILITIIVFNIKAPEAAGFAALTELIPAVSSFALGFLYLGIYWNNHHHLLYLTQRINGRVLWANLHLLFWLALLPFATNWLSQTGVEQAPVAIYGAILLLAGIAYVLLQTEIVRANGPDSDVAKALGRDGKGKWSMAAYSIAIPIAFWIPVVSVVIYTTVALVWLIPDRRLENAVQSGPGARH